MVALTHYIIGDIDQAALLAPIEQRGELVTFGSEPALILAMETHDYDGMLCWLTIFMQMIYTPSWHYCRGMGVDLARSGGCRPYPFA